MAAGESGQPTWLSVIFIACWSFGLRCEPTCVLCGGCGSKIRGHVTSFGLRCEPTASISSMKMMHGARSRRREELAHALPDADEDLLELGAAHVEERHPPRLARHRAREGVLPLPGVGQQAALRQLAAQPRELLGRAQVLDDVEQLLLRLVDADWTSPENRLVWPLTGCTSIPPKPSPLGSDFSSSR